jgi:magnesium chelatase subunit I
LSINKVKPANLRELKDSGWVSRPVKEEVRQNLLDMLQGEQVLFPGIIGYESTVIPEIIIALLAGHDMLFMGEKGQAKSRLMRMLVRFLDEEIPYLADGEIPLHEDPYNPITRRGRQLIAERPAGEAPIAWWGREDRYAERLAPGTKFADLIGEIDPARLASGTSMSAEEAMHFGLIPRMHRGIFAVNEVPELDEQVQVGLFNILEERDVQIRGYPVRFDVDTLVLFSANPSTYNRSGKVIPQIKDRVGAVVRTHYPLDRDTGIEIMQQEAAVPLDGEFPLLVPRFMSEIIEQISICARRSKYVDQESGVSARFSIANYRTLLASARRRAVAFAEKPAVPRVSDLAHIHASSRGKLELDLMGTSQMNEDQVLEAVIAEAIANVFEEYVEKASLESIPATFAKGVRIEVGDMLPSSAYAERFRLVPAAWEKAFEVNPARSDAVRASCVEFVLAGLYATDRISRSEHHGRIVYEIP